MLMILALNTSRLCFGSLRNPRKAPATGKTHSSLSILGSPERSRAWEIPSSHLMLGYPGNTDAEVYQDHIDQESPVVGNTPAFPRDDRALSYVCS